MALIGSSKEGVVTFSETGPELIRGPFNYTNPLDVYNSFSRTNEVSKPSTVADDDCFIVSNGSTIDITTDGGAVKKASINFSSEGFIHIYTSDSVEATGFNSSPSRSSFTPSIDGNSYSRGFKSKGNLPLIAFYTKPFTLDAGLFLARYASTDDGGIVVYAKYGSYGNESDRSNSLCIYFYANGQIDFYAKGQVGSKATVACFDENISTQSPAVTADDKFFSGDFYENEMLLIKIAKKSFLVEGVASNYNEKLNFNISVRRAMGGLIGTIDNIGSDGSFSIEYSGAEEEPIIISAEQKITHVWKPGASFIVGDCIHFEGSQYIHKVTVSGVTGGSMPVWAEVSEGITVDGTVEYEAFKVVKPVIEGYKYSKEIQ